MTFAPVLLAGAGCGLFLVLAGYLLLPARPDLGAALARLDASRQPDRPPSAPAPDGHSLPERLGALVERLVGRHVSMPHKDLELLGISPEQHLGSRAAWALFGAAFPQVMLVLLAAGGIGVPFVVPAGVSLGFGALMWVHSGREVHTKARTARHECRWAIASYMERVALARLARSGAGQALTRTAEVGDGWIFARLRSALEHSKRSNRSAWQALKQVSDDLEVPELGRPAETLALAGEDGAPVYATLQAQSKQLRQALRTDAKAEANTATSNMVVPVVALVLLLMAFLGYPAIITILST